MCVLSVGDTTDAFATHVFEAPEHVKRMTNNASSQQFEQLTCHLKFVWQAQRSHSGV